MSLAQRAMLVGLFAGGLLGYSYGLSVGRNTVQVSSYNKGVADGIQYADDTAREGDNCGVRAPFPKEQP